MLGGLEPLPGQARGFLRSLTTCSSRTDALFLSPPLFLSLQQSSCQLSLLQLFSQPFPTRPPSISSRVYPTIDKMASTRVLASRLASQMAASAKVARPAVRVAQVSKRTIQTGKR